MKRTEGWPDVLEPVCSSCKRECGKKHDINCDRVYTLGRYDVLLKDGKKVGSLLWYDPYHWNLRDCEAHKNNCTTITGPLVLTYGWCIDTAFQNIEWIDLQAKSLAEDMFENPCTCAFLALRYSELVDNAPYVEET